MLTCKEEIVMFIQERSQLARIVPESGGLNVNPPRGGAELGGRWCDVALPVLAGEHRAATLTPVGCRRGGAELSRGDHWVRPGVIPSPVIGRQKTAHLKHVGLAKSESRASVCKSPYKCQA